MLEVLSINRSTLSFHLTKMVNAGILNVRINPTGRATKYYSLSDRIFKFELDEGISRDKNEKIAAINLNLQQMAFEFKIASNLINDYSNLIMENNDFRDVNITNGKISLEINKSLHEIINGGIFYTSKDHARKFMEEMGLLLAKFKFEIKVIAKDEITASQAIVFGGFPLPNPIKIFIKKNEKLQ